MRHGKTLSVKCQLSSFSYSMQLLIFEAKYLTERWEGSLAIPLYLGSRVETPQDYEKESSFIGSNPARDKAKGN